MAATKGSDQRERGDGENYVHDYEAPVTKRMMGSRTAGNSAAFYQTYLQPGQKLLDIGCGLGTITVGLARAVSPGQAVGVDIAESQVSAARERATNEGVSNVRFAVGDAYHLDFEDNSFDAVFSNAMIEHLATPVDVLREARRVLRPGGSIGVRAADGAAWVWYPEDPLLEAHKEMYLRFRRHNGGHTAIGRTLRALLREAGFQNTCFSASCDANFFGTTEQVKSHVEGAVQELAGPRIRDAAIRLGWADDDYFDRVVQHLRAWHESPDSFWTFIWGEGIGWKA